MRHRVILVIATLAALLLGSAATASASQAGWPTMQRCARGAFTGEWVGNDSGGQPAVWVSGWIQPCSPPVDDRFGVIYYVQDRDGAGPHGYVHLGRLRRYTEGSGQSPLQGTIDASVEALRGQLLGICLAYRVGGLVACTQPGRVDGSGPPPPPLPPLRELAAVEVTLVPDTGPSPNCGSCV
jgi:hypothetical protein